MATYEITAEMNLKKIIAESREIAQALNEFADNLKQIEEKYAESKTGHWIDNKARKNLCNCSECGALSNVYSDFCPHCGAKMGEGGANETSSN